MGDGWNAGGINLFDHFTLDSRRELKDEVMAAMDSNDPATAAARRGSYKNTMLGGFTREIPVCLGEGEYLFSTEFQNSKMEPLTTYGPYSAAATVFSVGGRHYAESTWSFCGGNGTLSDYTFLRVENGNCKTTQGWGETAAPATTPVVGATLSPTPSPGAVDGGEGGEGGEGGNDGNENRGGEDDGSTTTDDGGDTLTDLEIFAIGLGALLLAAGAAAGGTYAQNKGWFAPAAAGGAAGAAAGGGGAPNPDSDEFAP